MPEAFEGVEVTWFERLRHAGGEPLTIMHNAEIDPRGRCDGHDEREYSGRTCNGTSNYSDISSE